MQNRIPALAVAVVFILCGGVAFVRWDSTREQTFEMDAWKNGDGRARVRMARWLEKNDDVLVGVSREFVIRNFGEPTSESPGYAEFDFYTDWSDYHHMLYFEFDEEGVVSKAGLLVAD